MKKAATLFTVILFAVVFAVTEFIGLLVVGTIEQVILEPWQALKMEIVASEIPTYLYDSNGKEVKVDIERTQSLDRVYLKKEVSPDTPWLTDSEGRTYKAGVWTNEHGRKGTKWYVASYQLPESDEKNVAGEQVKQAWLVWTAISILIALVASVKVFVRSF